MVIVQMGSKNLQEKLLALVQAVHESSACWMYCNIGSMTQRPNTWKDKQRIIWAQNQSIKAPSWHQMHSTWGKRLLFKSTCEWTLEFTYKESLCVQTYSLSNIQNGVLKGLIIGSVETLCVHFSDLFIFFRFQFFSSLLFIYLTLCTCWKCSTCMEFYTLFRGLSVKSNVIERFAFLELACCCI